MQTLLLLLRWDSLKWLPGLKIHDCDQLSSDGEGSGSWFALCHFVAIIPGRDSGMAKLLSGMKQWTVFVFNESTKKWFLFYTVAVI